MKKLNKFFAVLVALAMMAVLGVTSAFAEGNPNEANVTTVKVTKKVTKAEGLTLPETTFNFTVGKVSYNGYTDDTTKDGMPTINGTSIPVSGAADKVNAYRIGTLDFSAFTASTVKPGVYVYQIREAIPNPLPDGFTSYDSHYYEVSVSKTNDGNVTLFIQKDGEGEKLDATTEKDTGENSDGLKMTDVMFTNDYTKNAEGTDPGEEADDHKASFYLKKNVDATYGDKEHDFSFTLTINGGTPTKIVKVKDGTDTEVTSLNNLTLRDGEILAVYGLPVGATYSVTENLDNTDATEKQYISSVDVIENGTKTEKSVAYDAEGTKGVGAVVTNALIGEDANHADYLNTNQDAQDNTPTGILINNLPYIALALVAIGGLVAYVVVRRRQNDEA